MSRTADRIFIFAGTYKQASDFAKQKKLQPTEWIFLHSPEQLRGLRDNHLFV